MIAYGLLPWLLPRLAARWPGAAMLDRLYVAMCHRLPERTLVLAGASMPLCSRCAGLVAGAALGALLARPALPTGRWPPLILAGGALMAADVITQDLGWHPVWHPVRLATGALFGYVVTVAALAAFGRADPAP